MFVGRDPLWLKVFHSDLDLRLLLPSRMQILGRTPSHQKWPTTFSSLCAHLRLWARLSPASARHAHGFISLRRRAVPAARVSNIPRISHPDRLDRCLSLKLYTRDAAASALSPDVSIHNHGGSSPPGQKSLIQAGCLGKCGQLVSHISVRRTRPSVLPCLKHMEPRLQTKINGL